MRPKRLLIQKFNSETRRQNIRGFGNDGYGALVANRGGGKPIEILHIFGEIVGEVGSRHAADPTDEIAARKGFDTGSAIHRFQFPKAFGRWARSQSQTV